jgi:hypothetical protein
MFSMFFDRLLPSCCHGRHLYYDAFFASRKQSGWHLSKPAVRTMRVTLSFPRELQM